MYRYFLCILICILGLNSFAQKTKVDSLITLKKQWTSKESIQFKTQLSKNRPVSTRSCACGDKDFYYQIYKWENGQWKLWRNHSEDPEKDKMCECKRQDFIFKDQMTYKIPAISEKGKYQLRISGKDFILFSNDFMIQP